MNLEGISDVVVVLVTDELLATEDDLNVRLSWGRVDVYTDCM